MTPFSLRIFVADGDPDGLRIVEWSNWVGRALVFRRLAMAQPSVATRPELHDCKKSHSCSSNVVHFTMCSLFCFN